MKDYLIVGAGLAGLAFAEVSIRQGKSVAILDDCSQNASLVAAGLYNPLAIKRLKPVPDAGALLAKMHGFYERVSHGSLHLHPMRLLRRFHSVEEQNQWIEASDSPLMSQWIDDQIIRDVASGIEAPFGYGGVSGTGYVDTRQFISGYRKFLSDSGVLKSVRFDYRDILMTEDSISYDWERYGCVVFAEGFGLHQNPFFNYLPLNGTKGEILLISASELDLSDIVNAGIFILPIGESHYRVGATYEHHDKSNDPTELGRKELEQKLRAVLKCKFEVLGHEAGVRPTVRDRQPLLGRHPHNSRIAILNGLGTRGVLFAPSLAEALFEHLESDIPLPTAWDITRFKYPASGNG